MLTEVSSCSCLMGEIPNGETMGYSTVRPLDYSRDQHIHWVLLEDNHIDTLHTLCVCPIHNQFWQYPHGNVYQLWQPDELHQLPLCLVKDMLYWVLEYLKAKNVKHQFDNRFTSVPQYSGFQHLCKPFAWVKSGTWHGTEIHGMSKTPALNCTPFLVSSNYHRKTAAQIASDRMVMGAVRALCHFSPPVRQQNHSDISL